MSTKEDAVDRWFLTIHDRAVMTQAVKAMFGFENSDNIGTHKVQALQDWHGMKRMCKN